MKPHTIKVIQVADDFSAHTEYVCAICHYRLIHLIGFSVEWWHGYRRVKAL